MLGLTGLYYINNSNSANNRTTGCLRKFTPVNLFAVGSTDVLKVVSTSTSQIG